MKDTRAGGGAFSCKWLRMNGLETRVVGFHTEPGFFAEEIKSPPNPCIHGTGSFFFVSSFFIPSYFIPSYLDMSHLFCIFVL